jgi:hypothetical protein
MEIDSIGRASEAIISPIAPSPASEEPSKEQESPPPETAQDSGKILDLYA